MLMRLTRNAREGRKRDAPEPPAAFESWAKPTDAGFDRKTEYTFFWKMQTCA